MKTFADSTGRTWHVTINVAAIKAVRALVAVDLLEIEGKLLERLSSDPILLCDVLYALCKEQADARAVSDEDFGRSMAGNSIEQATAAFLEELVDFFPSRRRELLHKALTKLRGLETMVLSAAAARLDSGLIEKMMATELARGLEESGAPSADSPPSPAPIPIP